MPVDLPVDVQAKGTARLQQALFFGTGTGIFGTCAGGATGILRSAHPGIAAAYTGVQFFVLGSSASLTRDILFGYQGPTRSRRDELAASTGAGLVSGALAGRFWPRLSFIPCAIFCGLVGYLGQRAMHKSLDTPRQERDHRTIMQRLADSRWSPLKSLSNEDYEEVLTQRLIKLEAEIAVIDEKLRDLRTVVGDEKD